MAVFANFTKAISSLPANKPLAQDTIGSLSSHLPENFTFTDLLDALQDLKQTVNQSPCAWPPGEPSLTASIPQNPPKASLWAILVCLKNKDRIQSGPDTEDGQISSLCDYVAAVIAPCSKSEEDQDADSAASEYDDIVGRSLELAAYGLEILQIFSDEYHAVFSDDTLFTIIAFSDAWWQEPSSETVRTDRAQEPFPWTGRETSNVARRALEQQFTRQPPLPDLLAETVLKGYLRPLFSRSRPKNVTASGRKAAFADEDDAPGDLRDESRQAKPWKYADHRAIAEPLVSKQWPLFTPVLTALLADGETRVRWRGLYCLQLFLDRLPGDVLRGTGLHDVFKHAVFPTLHYLPRLTPVDESARLLTAAYAALRALSQRVGTTDQRLLDEIMRDGIFSAYFHAKEYPRIVTILAEQTKWVVEDMGINAVKHLKDLIPMFSEIMTEPFTYRLPHDMSKTINALQVIISNCWPRIASTPAYQDEIIKALVTCYLNAHDDKQGTSSLQGPLSLAASMLSRAMASGGSEEIPTTLKDKVAPLIAREAVLADLFKCI